MLWGNNISKPRKFPFAQRGGRALEGEEGGRLMGSHTTLG